MVARRKSFDTYWQDAPLEEDCRRYRRQQARGMKLTRMTKTAGRRRGVVAAGDQDGLEAQAGQARRGHCSLGRARRSAALRRL